MKIPEFICGYFVYLDSRGISAALLHGWEDSFEGPISDIDYVIDPAAFPRIAQIVNDYCVVSGWRLCQVLRHEDTAAFCVCSAIDDPACVVALDACSDYRRSGRMLIPATDLLRDRETLVWGGFRLSPQMEFRYRFIKAAAKRKPADEALPGLLAMAEEAQTGFADWMAHSWGISVETMDQGHLTSALETLTKRCNTGNKKHRLLSASRMIRRILKPDGMLLLTSDLASQQVQAITQTFSGLYFRRHKTVSPFSARNRIDLIRSVLVFAPKPSALTTLIIPRDCILSPPQNPAGAQTLDWIAQKLHNRCKARENIASRVIRTR